MKSMLHIAILWPDGTFNLLAVGGGAPDDAMRVVQEALETGAVSISLIREVSKS